MTRFLLVAASLCIPLSIALAQSDEDILRPGEQPYLMSARAMSMGNAFIGIADDLGALHFNPAGLAQLQRDEFDFGLSNLSVDVNAHFLGSSEKSSDTKTGLQSIGMAVPFPVARGSFVVAASYFRLTDFVSRTGFSGYNTQSSIQPTLFQQDPQYDLAWNLGLEDTIPSIPIQNDVLQTGEVLQSGGLNEWSFGGSAEVAPHLMIGIAFNVVTGTYEWDRTITESDPNGVHSGTIAGVDFDRSGFQKATFNDYLMQDISGWNLRFGMLYRLEDRARIGIAIQSPTLVSISENFQRSGSSWFAVPQNTIEKWSLPETKNSYDVNTNWVFSFGASFSPESFITISADIDLSDFSQFVAENFSASDFDQVQFNRQLKTDLRATTNLRVGAEVNIPNTGLFLRGGFGLVPTPYASSSYISSNFDRKTISGGVGYQFDPSFTLNGTFFITTYSGVRDLYFEGPALPESTTPSGVRDFSFDTTQRGILLSAVYRF